jgi:hypothetical protein
MLLKTYDEVSENKTDYWIASLIGDYHETIIEKDIISKVFIKKVNNSKSLKSKDNFNKRLSKKKNKRFKKKYKKYKMFKGISKRN